MSDREILELAAKAAGIEVELYENGYGEIESNWNPLTDDGDAFRLAVKRRIKFRYNEAWKRALAWVGGTSDCEAYADIEECGGDENACCRLAVVRVAAEIGRQMK